MNVDRMKKLLQQAVPPVKDELERDLWPAMLRRMDRTAAPAFGFNWAWFDAALAIGVATLAAFFPVSIPLLLYYL